VLPGRRSGRAAAVTDLARTAGFYAGLGAGLSLGAVVGALNRSRAPVIDLGSSLGAELALAAAGIDVHVAGGEEHLWSSRPCVFAFNHQSKIDPIVVMKLLRGGFTGVAKKEAKDIPFFGVAFQLAGVAFVDRGNATQARRALEPAVAKLRAGTSLARSLTGTVAASGKSVARQGHAARYDRHELPRAREPWDGVAEVGDEGRDRIISL
jgi:putative phosphoserine phosphatase/1-acylglycerol-3-phosphate O-acyltransferase